MPLVALAARAMRENMPAEIARFVPGWENLGADWRTLAFSAVVAVLAAARLQRRAGVARLAARPQRGAPRRRPLRHRGGSRQRGRNLLVVAQVAGALALLVAAGVAVRSADALARRPPGLRARGVLTFEVTLSDARYSEPEKRRGFVREVEARLAELPGVEAVAATNTLPGRNGYTTRPIEVEGQPLAKGQRAAAGRGPRRDAGPLRDAAAAARAGRGLEATDTEDSRAGGGGQPGDGRALLAGPGPDRQALPPGRTATRRHAVARASSACRAT